MKKILGFGITVIILSMSCSNGVDLPPANDELDSLENIPQWAIQLMQRMPANVNDAGFIDIEAYKNSVSAGEVYQDFEHLFNDIRGASTIIDFDQLEYLGIFGKLSALLFVAKSNLSQKVEVFMDNGWTYKEYKGFKIWKKEKTYAVIDSNYITFGTNTALKDMIKTDIGEQPSLYSDAHFRALISRLPNGWSWVGYKEYTAIKVSLAHSSNIIARDALSTDEGLAIEQVIVATSANLGNAEGYIREMMKGFQEDDEFQWEEINISNEGSYWKVTAKRSLKE